MAERSRGVRLVFSMSLAAIGVQSFAAARASTSDLISAGKAVAKATSPASRSVGFMLAMKKAWS
jgi:hypothetical protein